MQDKTKYYILDGRSPKASSFDEWSEWIFEHFEECFLAKNKHGGYEATTRFTGKLIEGTDVDIFSTTIQDNRKNVVKQFPSHTREEALEIHKNIWKIFK